MAGLWPNRFENFLLTELLIRSLVQKRQPLYVGLLFLYSLHPNLNHKDWKSDWLGV